MRSGQNKPNYRHYRLLVRVLLVLTPLLVFTHDMAMSMHGEVTVTPAVTHLPEAHGTSINNHHDGLRLPAQKSPCHMPMCPQLENCGTHRVLQSIANVDELNALSVVADLSTEHDHLARSGIPHRVPLRAMPGRDILSNHHILII